MFCLCWRFSAVEKNGSKNMHQILCKKWNRRITIIEVAEDISMSVGSFHAIFSDILGLKRVAA